MQSSSEEESSEEEQKVVKVKPAKAAKASKKEKASKKVGTIVMILVATCGCGGCSNNNIGLANGAAVGHMHVTCIFLLLFVTDPSILHLEGRLVTLCGPIVHT